MYLHGVGGQRHASAALPPGMSGFPLYKTLGGFQGRVQKILPPPASDILTV